MRVDGSDAFRVRMAQVLHLPLDRGLRRHPPPPADSPNAAGRGRRWPRLLLPLLLAALPAAAQPTPVSPVKPDPLQLYAYTLEHQSAMEALKVIQPLLSRQGSVEVRLGENTLVIRDSLSAISKIAPILRRFDQPARRLRIEVMIIEAQRAPFSPAVPGEPLPDRLTMRLRGALPFSDYRLIAKTVLEVMEGEDATYEMREGFAVSFRPGPVIDGGVRLYAFRIARTGEAEQREGKKHLLQSSLSLRLGQPMTLALTRAEDSQTALMVLLTPSLAAEPRRLEAAREKKEQR